MVSTCGRLELGEAAQIDRQAVGGELGDLFRARPGFVPAFHNPGTDCTRAGALLQSAAMAKPATPAPSTIATAAPKTFQPYVPASEAPAEFTFKAILLGAIFGVIFGAVTVYLALRAGLTVSRSIPIAVLAIAVFKRFSKSTILENNIVQTIGSAGESIASGVVFTIPAFLFIASGGAKDTSTSFRS